MKRLFATAAAIACALLSACGNGTGTPQALPAAATSSSSVHISILVPSATANHTLKRQYVSPSVKSASVRITPNAGCGACTSTTTFDAALSQGASNCATVPAGLQCTINVVLNPGSYTGTMDTYDGPLAGGKATGTILSENGSFPIAVVAGTANQVPLALDGVPTTLSVTPLDTTTSSAQVNNTISVLNNTSNALYAIVATDADGNLITGPGAPTYSANITCPGCSSVITGSVTGTQLKLSVALSGGAIGDTGTVTITANSPSGCSPSIAVCSLALTVGMAQLMSVVSNGAVTLWYPALTLPPVTLTNVTSPSDAEFDTSGSLWVANAGNSTITRFDPPFIASSNPTLTLSTGLANPNRIYIQKTTGTIFAASNTFVSAFASPYTSAPAVIANGINQPVDFGVGPSNRLFVANYGSSAVTAYDPPYNGAAPAVTLTGAISSPKSLLVYSDGSLWCANSGAGTVVHYPSPPYGFGPDISVPGSPLANLLQPNHVTNSSVGIMTSDPIARDINVYSSSGSFITQIGSSWTMPDDVTFDRYGLIYVADAGSTVNSVSVFAPGSHTGSPTIRTLGNLGGAKRIQFYP